MKIDDSQKIIFKCRKCNVGTITDKFVSMVEIKPVKGTARFRQDGTKKDQTVMVKCRKCGNKTFFKDSKLNWSEDD